MKLKIPPPVYMLLFAFAMWLCSRYIPIFEWRWDTRFMGIIIILCGIMIDLISLAGFIASKTSINPIHPEKARHLVTSGMHRFSRNPMYLGLLLLLTGWFFHLGALSPLLLIPLFILTLTKMQIQPEETILEDLFGQAYRDYKRTVRRWL